MKVQPCKKPSVRSSDIWESLTIFLTPNILAAFLLSSSIIAHIAIFIDSGYPILWLLLTLVVVPWYWNVYYPGSPWYLGWMTKRLS